MPNISFDIFFDQDFVNISASRGKHAPKAKPEWKVRTAPKLPPKETPADPTATPRPVPRPPINSTRAPSKLASKSKEDKDIPEKPTKTSEAGSEAGDKPRRKPPKLGPRKNAANGNNSDPTPAGAFAGGALNTVGTGISGVGESINGTIKRYGDGVRDYGNGVMDWSSATGPRAQTASNPLGLSGGAATGKRSVTSPSIYSAPSKPKPSTTKAVTTTNKTGQPQKKIQNIPAKKATSVAKTNPPVKKTPVKPTPVSKSVQGVKKPTPVKTSTASTNRAKLPSTQKVNHVAAANPLGLK